jgi:hypothetical protein
MPCLRAVDVDDSLVDEIWQKVSHSGSYYSIGDGVAKKTFRRVLFESPLVLRGEDFVIRFELHEDCVELHPIVFGPQAFHDVEAKIGELTSFSNRLFAQKPLCCIIPIGMRGAKRLAHSAGFAFHGVLDRSLSGVNVRCAVFVKRSQDE